MRHGAPLLAVLAVTLSCSGARAPAAATTPTARAATTTLAEVALGAPVQQWHATVVATLAHDPALFTEGLELDANVRYESSGLYGSSVVRAIDEATGATLHAFTLPLSMFAEGIARVGDRLLVLTWKEHTAFVLDAATLSEVSRLTYASEGWGMCTLGPEVVTSDGTDTLTFRDPTTLAALRTTRVRLGEAPVTNLNELECVKGVVYANVWQTNRIVRVEPTTGFVSGFVDVPELRPPSTLADPDAVPNGIAYEAATDTFLITGKRWPVMYRVTFASS